MMRLTLVLLAVLVTVPAVALEGGVATEGPFRVRAVLSGSLIELWDKRQVRLARIRAPEPWRGDATLTRAAQEVLAGLTLNKDVVLTFSGPRYDRYGRLVARVDTVAGLWVQAAMVGRGWAQVHTDETQRDGMAELLALEAAARTANRGLWRDWRYQVLDPETAGRVAEGFHVVEGTVLSVSTVGAWTYLNFGPDWRSDFTISIHRGDRARMREGLGRLESLAGRDVRVRGWVSRLNGPMIEATYPEQIEVLR